MNPEKSSPTLLCKLVSVLLLLSVGCTTTRPTGQRVTDTGKLVFVDQLENGYIIREQRSLLKYNYRNIPESRYDFDVTIWEAGLSTDLRFFAFNEDYQSFYVLDQYLNEVSKISFNQQLNFMAMHPVLADGHMIWLYNPTENKLEKYTTQLEKVTESRSLNREIPGLRVDQIFFHKNQIYVNDYNKGVYIFDYTGRLVRQILLPLQSNKAQIDEYTSRLYIYIRNAWHFVDLYPRIPETEKVILPPEMSYSTDLIFQNEKVYRWNTETQSVEHFSLEKE